MSKRLYDSKRLYEYRGRYEIQKLMERKTACNSDFDFMLHIYIWTFPLSTLVMFCENMEYITAFSGGSFSLIYAQLLLGYLFFLDLVGFAVFIRMLKVLLLPAGILT